MEPKDMPQGLQYKSGLIFGTRPTHPGLLEIKYHNPKTRNSMGPELNALISDLVDAAGDDPNIKCILLYGSRNIFSSGNDISIFTKGDAAVKHFAEHIVVSGLTKMI